MQRSRTPLIAAISFVVLVVVGTVFLGTPPHVEDSAETTIAWLRAYHDAVPVVAMCFTLAVIPFLVLAAWTRRALPPVYGYAFLAAAGAFVAQTMVLLWFSAGAALHADTIDPGIARSLLDVGAYYGPMLATTDVVMAGAVALVGLREGALPRWLGWVSAVFALEQLIETATVYGDSGFAAPGGDWNTVLGAGLFGVWVLALGFALSRAPVQPTT